MTSASAKRHQNTGQRRDLRIVASDDILQQQPRPGPIQTDIPGGHAQLGGKAFGRQKAQPKQKHANLADPRAQIASSLAR